MIPQDIIDEYNLTTIVHRDGYCYTEIRKAMYVFRKVGYVTNIKLKRVIGLEDYVPSKFTTGLFILKTKDIVFILVVDDFGGRYTKRENAGHLLKTIQDRYHIKAD